jgi:plastocyanin
VRSAILALAAAGLLAAAPSSSAAPPTKLIGTVGPEFTISLTDAEGNPVTTLKAGLYTIVVNDKSGIHDFHLMGPGLDRVITDVDFVGTRSVTVALAGGRYRYQCDPHFDQMKGSFTAGPAPKLFGAVGPGFTISLKTAKGQKVKTLAAGPYTFVAADKSSMHDFTLKQTSGGTFQKALTGLGFVGKKTVNVNLTPGRWEFFCRPHRSRMSGKFSVRSLRRQSPRPSGSATPSTIRHAASFPVGRDRMRYGRPCHSPTFARSVREGSADEVGCEWKTASSKPSSSRNQTSGSTSSSKRYGEAAALRPRS